MAPELPSAIVPARSQKRVPDGATSPVRPDGTLDLIRRCGHAPLEALGKSRARHREGPGCWLVDEPDRRRWSIPPQRSRRHSAPRLNRTGAGSAWVSFVSDLSIVWPTWAIFCRSSVFQSLIRSRADGPLIGRSARSAQGYLGAATHRAAGVAEAVVAVTEPSTARLSAICWLHAPPPRLNGAWAQRQRAVHVRSADRTCLAGDNR